MVVLSIASGVPGGISNTGSFQWIFFGSEAFQDRIIRITQKFRHSSACTGSGELCNEGFKLNKLSIISNEIDNLLATIETRYDSLPDLAYPFLLFRGE